MLDQPAKLPRKRGSVQVLGTKSCLVTIIPAQSVGSMVTLAGMEGDVQGNNPRLVEFGVQEAGSGPLSSIRLRDLFAAAALQGLIAHEINRPLDFGSLAGAAYKAADAMLAFRQQVMARDAAQEARDRE